MHWAPVATIAVAAAACSPSLNWREVHVGELTTLLPCKPDRATRPITLEGETVNLEMAGCEAAGALYTVSRIQMEDATRAQAIMVRLRRASLASVHASNIRPAANSGDEHSSFDVQVDGKDPAGSAVQAHFKWMMQGQSTYQVAVYAPTLHAGQVEGVVDGVRFQ
jgi:hypothetical protein